MRQTAFTRGSAYVEFLVAIIPMLVIFWGLLQISGLLLADLVVRHAAMNAVRAAIVCDSDENTTGQSGAQTCALQAATDTTRSVSSITATRVTVNGASEQGNSPVTVSVSADYRCQLPLVGGLACSLAAGGAASTATIQRSATLPNQGHYYKF